MPSPPALPTLKEPLLGSEKPGRGAPGRACKLSLTLGLTLCCAWPSLRVAHPAAPLHEDLDAPQPAAPPLFHIDASSPFDAGLQHGRLARSRIAGWLGTAEMRKVFAFTQSANGSAALARLREDNAREFPAYAEELDGIAVGSGFSSDWIWSANLLNELGSLMGAQGFQAPPEHCSDVYAVAPRGFAQGFSHGRNDDWSAAAKPFWYLTSYTYRNASAVGFRACAGVTYPATLVGWAPTWNPSGMYATQNSMVPRASRAGGLACAFVQRRAVCASSSLEEMVRALTVPGWSDGASMNIVDLRGRRMANVELWEDSSSVFEITDAIGNYTHFNEYKHLTLEGGGSIDDPRVFARDPRQDQADTMAPPRSVAEMKAVLSDSKIFRPDATLMTLVLDGSTGQLDVWSATPSSLSSPVFSWNLLTFFD